MGWLRGFEPPTTGITIQYSNQLSYSHHGSLPGTRRLARPAGIEPATTGLEGRCSIRLSYGRPIRILACPRRRSGVGRGRGIRTPDILLPKQARYQTALYPAGVPVPPTSRDAMSRTLSGACPMPVNARAGRTARGWRRRAKSAKLVRSANGVPDRPPHHTMDQDRPRAGGRS